MARTDFAYNTAVVHVNNVYIHNTYVDRTVVERNTIVNEHRVAYSGGPGGINHQPLPEERNAMHEQHMGATSVQQQHMQAARSDKSFYAKNNGGHPQTMAAARPMGYNSNHAAEGNARPQQQNSSTTTTATRTVANRTVRNIRTSPRGNRSTRTNTRTTTTSSHSRTKIISNRSHMAIINSRGIESRPAPHSSRDPQPQHEEKAPKEPKEHK